MSNDDAQDFYVVAMIPYQEATNFHLVYLDRAGAYRARDLFVKSIEEAVLSLSLEDDFGVQMIFQPALFRAELYTFKAIHVRNECVEHVRERIARGSSSPIPGGGFRV